MTERGLGGERIDRSREMSSKMTNGSHITNIWEFSKSRQIEVSSIKSFDKRSYRGSIEEQINRKDNKEAQSIHLVVKRCRDCNKKKLKSSIDSQELRRCRKVVEIV